MSGRPVLVFGTGSFSRLLRCHLELEARRPVAAFVVDAAWRTREEQEGLPVVALEEVAGRYPPHTHDMLLPLGCRDMHAFRARKIAQCRQLGYRTPNWIAPGSSVLSPVPGDANVLMYENVTVQPLVHMGRDVTLRSGVNIGHDTRLGDHCTLASGVVTGGRVDIGEGCWVGLGAVIRNGVRLAPRTFVGAGAVVLRDTESEGVYVGVPARRLPDKSAIALSQHEI